MTVYDLGQNFSGWPEISVRGPRGSAVKLIPGELLTDEGVVTQRSFDGPVWFTYTLGRQGGERWHPRFYLFRFSLCAGASSSSSWVDYAATR